jgi:hypothetical protein
MELVLVLLDGGQALEPFMEPCPFGFCQWTVTGHDLSLFQEECLALEEEEEQFIELVVDGKEALSLSLEMVLQDRNVALSDPDNLVEQECSFT